MAYEHCVCCSPSILNHYTTTCQTREEQIDFLQAVCNDLSGEGNILERISGLHAIKEAMEQMYDDVDFDFDDLSLSDDEEKET